MVIGFNNGVFYRLGFDRLSEKIINAFRINNVNAIEFSCINEKIIDNLLNASPKDYKCFEYISVHAPDINYGINEISHRILKKIKKISRLFNVQNIIIHPDVVDDWSIFNDYNSLPISIENMDERKKFGKTVSDIKTLLNKYNFGFTLDLQHCFVNDNKMKLAEDFQELFKSRIVEYHISGYDKNLSHHPLYKTKQDIIIKSLKRNDIPIIIESNFDQLDDIKHELAYIKDKINSTSNINFKH